MPAITVRQLTSQLSFIQSRFNSWPITLKISPHGKKIVMTLHRFQGPSDGERVTVSDPMTLNEMDKWLDGIDFALDFFGPAFPWAK